MGLFDNIDGLLPGLLPGAWRGRQFWVPNADHIIGRRVHAQLYPGLDLKTHDDTGPLDGPIRIDAFVIGDDYVAQATALEAAFRQPGPATLLHPWRGPIRCVLLRPAKISYDTAELRIARIDAEFDPVSTGSLVSLATSLAGVIAAISGLTGAATALAGQVLSISPMALTLFSRGQAAAGLTLDLAESVSTRSRRSAVLLPAITIARSQLDTANAAGLRSESAPLIATVATDLAEALAATSRPQPRSGIGPGGAAPVTTPAPDPRAGAELLLTIAAAVGQRLRPAEDPGTVALEPLPAGAAPASALTERAVLVAAEAVFLAQAAGQITAVPFVSRQEAQGWAGRLDQALVRHMASVSRLAGEVAAPAAAHWRAVSELRARLAIDLSETIGRLPSVLMVTPPGTVSAFLIAQDLVGDDPAAIVAMVDDITRRNRLRHPARISGSIEVLK